MCIRQVNQPYKVEACHWELFFSLQSKKSTYWKMKLFLFLSIGRLVDRICNSTLQLRWAQIDENKRKKANLNVFAISNGEIDIKHAFCHTQSNLISNYKQLVFLLLLALLLSLLKQWNQRLNVSRYPWSMKNTTSILYAYGWRTCKHSLKIWDSLIKETFLLVCQYGNIGSKNSRIV